jgi:hypothetical protein
MKRGRSERHELTFERYAQSLEDARDMDLPDQRSVPQDVQLLVEEAKIVCTSAMLLCLNREQRLVFILGEMFGVTAAAGAEILETSAENFRQKLARARRDLYAFLDGQCGLVDPANPCRCAKKTRAMIDAGYVDPKRLMFLGDRVARVREAAEEAVDALETLDDRHGSIYRDHPFLKAPDFVESLRELLSSREALRVIDDRPR